jgi:hypothetical protein
LVANDKKSRTAVFGFRLLKLKKKKTNFNYMSLRKLHDQLTFDRIPVLPMKTLLTDKTNLSENREDLHFDVAG